MTKTERFIFLIIALMMLASGLGVWHPAHAQTAQGQVSGPTPVQQSTTHVDAATTAGTSASSAATITFAAVAGQSFYLTGIDITNCAGSAAVVAAAVTTITTTNITGSPAWTVGSGVAAGLCQPTVNTTWPTGLKSTAAGVATTIVLPTFATNQTIRVNAYGFYGL